MEDKYVHQTKVSNRLWKLQTLQVYLAKILSHLYKNITHKGLKHKVSSTLYIKSAHSQVKSAEFYTGWDRLLGYDIAYERA